MMMSAHVDSISANIVTDFDCPTDGTTACDTALLEFNTWAQAQEALGASCIDLHFPSQYTYRIGSTRIFEGIRRLRVFFNNAAVRSTSDDPAQALLIIGAGTGSIRFVETAQAHNAPIVTVYPGSRTVQLVTPAQHSKFTVGNWSLLTAIDTMGHGYPPNPAIHEFVKITAINTGTGLITLQSPIENEYRSTYPQFSGALELEQGGPAMLWDLDQTWDCEHDYYDLSLAVATQGQTYANGRIIRYHRPNIQTENSLVPSVNMLFEVRGGTLGSYMEADKIVDRMLLRNSALTSLLVQSTSINRLDLDNHTGSINGTPKFAHIRNSTIPELRLGCTGFGASREADVADSVVSSIVYSATGILKSEFTIDGSIVSRAAGAGGEEGYVNVPWAIPGTYVIFGSQQLGNRGMFKILDVTGTGGDTDILTDLASGWPSILGMDGGQMQLFGHPCPSVSFDSVTGCADAVDLSYAVAQGLPLYSYSKRSYTGNTFPTTPNGPINWGALVSITITVSQAYTGAQGTLTLGVLNQNDPEALTVDRSAQVTGWRPTINLKIAGTRVITPGSVTGAQSGDTDMSAPGAVWFMGRGTPYVSTAISGEASNLWPIVEIEIISDQGIAA